MRFALILLLLSVASVEARDPNLIGARVKSDSWRILRKKDRVEIFEGDVRYIKPERVLRADWARFNHGTGLFEARGHVRGRQRYQDGAWLEITGHSASHNKNTGKGELRPKKKNGRVTATLETGKGSAHLLRWNQLKETAVLEGDVDFKEERGTVRAERADYTHSTRSLVLTGRRPVVTGHQPGWSSAVQADIITATDLKSGRRRVSGKGRAQGWILFDGPDRRQYH